MSPSRELFGPSAFVRCRGPSFHTSYDVRLERIAYLSRSPAPRVWLPSQRCPLTTPSDVSFNTRRSWASPFRAFLLSRDPILLSKNRSAPALPYKTRSALYRRSSGFLPREKPCLSALPNGLGRGEAACSLELPVSRALPSLNRPVTSLSHPDPLAPFPILTPHGVE